MSRQRNPLNKNTRLSLESLEDRSLLSGFHSAAHVHVEDQHPAIVSTSAAKMTAAAMNSFSQSGEAHLVATLVDPAKLSSVTATATFESEIKRGATVSELSVQVKGATMGDVIDVKIADVSVGKVSVKADGTGQLKLKSTSLTVTADSVITLTATSTGTLLASGSFIAPVNKPESHDHPGEHMETHLRAATDPSIALVGTAKYESETEHGLVVSELSISVKGGKPNTEVEVLFAPDATTLAASIGKIALGTDGTGRLTLKANVPAVSQGSILTLNGVILDGSAVTTNATFGVITSTKS